MKIELAQPGTLEGLIDLNSALAASPEITVQLFTAADHGYDIADMDIRGEDDPVLERAALLHELHFEYQDEAEGMTTAFRAMAFARTLGSRLLQREIAATNYDFLPKHLGTLALQEHAAIMNHRYLAARSHLDLALDNFSHIITPERAFQGGAKAIAALELLAIDRDSQERYSQRLLRRFATEVRDWDGILTDLD